MHRFKENVRADVGLLTLSTVSTSVNTTGTSVDMKKYNNFCGLVGGVVATAVGSMQIYIAQSTDAATFSTAYIATATLSSSTVPNQGWFGSVECRAEQMSDGYRYLRVEAIPTQGTGAVITIANLRFNSRYPQANLPA